MSKQAHNGHYYLVLTDTLHRLPGSVRLRPLLLFPLLQNLGDTAFQQCSISALGNRLNPPVTESQGPVPQMHRSR